MVASFIATTDSIFLRCINLHLFHRHTFVENIILGGTILTHKELLRILQYDTETGIFTWKIKPSARVERGSIAGCINQDGYRRIKINKKSYMASRLAWFYVKRKWPKKEIDHKNRIRLDNRFENLREVSRKHQMANLNPRPRSLPKGVWKANKKFRASITYNYKKIYLGVFETIEEASGAYNNKHLELHGEI